MRFWKYHGLGNDFVIVNNVDSSLKADGALAEAICHRRFGVGADGLIVVERSNQADIRMIIYNSDGSRPEMCGNGVRCFAKFVYDKNIVRKNPISVETDAGIMYIDVQIEEEQVKTATVNMGQPDFQSASVPVVINQPEAVSYEVEIAGKTFQLSSLLMGVPHTVIFVDALEDEAVMELGKLIERASYFPRGTNVNFVQVLDREHIIMRTWERGAGYTYACGTGACASVVAGIANHMLADKVHVNLRGGDLVIHWRDHGDVYMEGPAAEVFEGNYLNCQK